MVHSRSHLRAKTNSVSTILSRWLLGSLHSLFQQEEQKCKEREQVNMHNFMDKVLMSTHNTPVCKRLAL